MVLSSEEEEYIAIISGITSKLRRLERQRTELVDTAGQKRATLEAELAAIETSLQVELESIDIERDRLNSELKVCGVCDALVTLTNI